MDEDKNIVQKKKKEEEDCASFLTGGAGCGENWVLLW